MQSQTERLVGNLDRLTLQFKDWAADLPEVAPDKRQRASKLAMAMPLTHGTSRERFFKICRARSILSQRQVRMAEGAAVQETDETFLGTDNDVFLYASIFRYPKAVAGLLFRATLEQHQDQAVATPFDSGGSRRMTRFSSNQQAVHDFIAEHELPVPEYRSLLENLLASSFNDPLEYLHPEMAPLFKPLPWMEHENDARGCTAEVRVAERIDVPHAELEAVFLPRSMAETVENLLEDFDSLGVKLCFVDADRQGDFRKIQRECFRYIKNMNGGAYDE